MDKIDKSMIEKHIQTAFEEKTPGHFFNKFHCFVQVVVTKFSFKSKFSTRNDICYIPICVRQVTFMVLDLYLFWHLQISVTQFADLTDSFHLNWVDPIIKSH